MEFPIPSAGLSEWIASGPDGTVWFTEGDGNRIGKITPNGVITEFATAVGSLPEGITIGPDGNLWFTEYSRNKIGTGKINPCQGSGIPCITSPASGVSPQSQFVVLTGTGTAHDLLNVLANGNPVGGGPVVVDSEGNWEALAYVAPFGHSVTIQVQDTTSFDSSNTITVHPLTLPPLLSGGAQAFGPAISYTRLLPLRKADIFVTADPTFPTLILPTKARRVPLGRMCARITPGSFAGAAPESADRRGRDLRPARTECSQQRRLHAAGRLRQGSSNIAPTSPVVA